MTNPPPQSILTDESKTMKTKDHYILFLILSNIWAASDSPNATVWLSIFGILAIGYFIALFLEALKA